MQTRKRKAIADALKPAVYRLTNLVTNPKADKHAQAVAKDCVVDLMAVISELEHSADQDV